jgi:hypothetical protein
VDLYIAGFYSLDVQPRINDSIQAYRIQTRGPFFSKGYEGGSIV